MISCNSRQLNGIGGVVFDEDNPRFQKLPLVRRCELLGVNRSTVYYQPKQPDPEKSAYEETLKNRLDYWHTLYPCLGERKLQNYLQRDGYSIGRKLTRRLMKEAGIYTIYPKRNLSKPAKGAQKLPYLLRNLDIFLPNQVWSLDITYLPMKHGHMYLTAIIDWYSRKIVGWELSDTLETAPVLAALKRAIARYGVPGILNSDQGSQFTSDAYQELLRKHHIRQSMDGKARWVDNVIIERWFRSLKTEYIYINEYVNPRELRIGIRNYVEEYNAARPHQSLEYRTPDEAYYSKFVA